VTTLQTILWAASNVISLVFGVLLGVGLVVAYVRKHAAIIVEQQERAAKIALELRKQFGLLGDDKK